MWVMDTFYSNWIQIWKYNTIVLTEDSGLLSCVAGGRYLETELSDLLVIV